MTASTSPSSPAASPEEWAASADEWIGTVHNVTLPSSRRVSFRDVSIGELAVHGELPEDLLEIVFAEWASPGAMRQQAVAPLRELPEKPTKKQRDQAKAEADAVVEKITRVNRHLIALALVKPKMTVEQLEQAPTPDVELLAALINRQTIVDAEGRHVGVVPLDRFRTVLAAHGHQPCPPDCPSCQTAGWALSALSRG